MIPAYPVRWTPDPLFVLVLLGLTLYWLSVLECHETTRFNRESKEQKP